MKMKLILLFISMLACTCTQARREKNCGLTCYRWVYAHIFQVYVHIFIVYSLHSFWFSTHYSKQIIFLLLGTLLLVTILYSQSYILPFQYLMLIFNVEPLLTFCVNIYSFVGYKPPYMKCIGKQRSNQRVFTILYKSNTSAG